jgi:hypothetical protein
MGGSGQDGGILNRRIMKYGRGLHLRSSVVLCALAMQTAEAQQTTAAATAAPTGTAVKVFVPIAWADVKIGDPDCRRMAKAAKELGEIRDSLCGILNRRIAADSAREQATDVILDLTEALAHYAIYTVRPPLGIASQWRDAVGRSTALERYWNHKEEFAPGREDVRFILQRRAGKWIGPRIGLVSSKFRQQFHLRDFDASALKADKNGVNGEMTVMSVRGDFRYDMHFSGESLDSRIPEFGVSHGTAFTDWWLGPRACLHPWKQRFSLQAAEPRGALLRARLTFATVPGKRPSRDLELFLWVENGLLLSGYANYVEKPPEFLVSVQAWSVQDKTISAEVAIGIGKGKAVYELRCSLSGPDAGALAGRFKTLAAREAAEGVVDGVLYRAFVGTYTSEGPDGRWTQQALAGVAPATSRTPDMPAAGVEARMAPQALFAQAVDLYRQVAAFDWSLREYPLPVTEALRGLREGADDRLKYWACYGGQRHSPAVPENMHEVLAGSLGRSAAGAAAYIEGLLRIARRALADRGAGAMPLVGMPEARDPDFGPHGGYRPAEQDASRGNLLPAPDDRASAWRLVGDWTCCGFVPRCWSFDSAPYLPEVLLERGIRPMEMALETGDATRVPLPDPAQHLWCWRANPTDLEGLVTVPFACLNPKDVKRTRWQHSEERLPQVFDFVYGAAATWYATTILHADKPGRVWMAMKVEWDGRLWVNDALVWRPARIHTPNRIAVFPVDLAAGPNRLTVCCSPRPLGEGNSGRHPTWVYKYGEKAFGSFAVWVARGVEPRPDEKVTAAQLKEQDADRERAAAAAAAGLRGPRGDGSARYPDARPALAWDIGKGVNVRWKASLPTDDAEPVIVGSRLFLTTFYGELACLDALTGAEHWRKQPRVEGAAEELPPYPPPVMTASYSPAARWAPPAKQQAPAPLKRKDVAPAGATARPTAAEMTALQRSCLTPLADARLVWMHDPRGRVACFDHQGRQVWARAVSAQVPRYSDGHYIAQHLMPPTPPAMAGKRLVAAVGEGLAAFDAEKGTALWRREQLDYLGQFAVLDLGSGPTGQYLVLGSGEVLDAATGATLIARCAPSMPDSGSRPLVEGRLVFLHAGSSAVRFWKDEDGALCHRVLWDSPTDVRKRAADMNGGLHGNSNNEIPSDFFSQGAYPPVPVLHQGLLFSHLAEPNSIEHGPQNNMRLNVYDAQTGCAYAQRFCIQVNAMRPVTSTVLAGGYIFGGDEGGRKAYDCPAFPSGTPMIAVVTAEEQPRRLASSPALATLAPPVFDGRRMYLAGSQQVVCIERPEALGDKFSECELDALKEGFFAREIGYRPETNREAVVPFPLDRMPAGMRTAIVPFALRGFGCRLLGAWPLKDQTMDHPYAAIAGTAGKVIEEGNKISAGGESVEFRAIPDETLVGMGGAGSYELNLPSSVSAIGISPAALFKAPAPAPAKGYLYVTLASRRTATLAMEFPDNLRCWLSGTEVKNGQYVRFTPGLYPFLVECRVTPENAKKPICPVFREFPVAPRQLGKYEADPEERTDAARHRGQRSQGRVRAGGAGRLGEVREVRGRR